MGAVTMIEFDALQRRDDVQTQPPTKRKVVQRNVVQRNIVQRKLIVRASNDPAEREADRLADEALRHSQSSGGDVVAGVAPASTTKIRRMPTTVGAAGGEVDTMSARRIESARSGGAALDDHTRTMMESGFGAD